MNIENLWEGYKFPYCNACKHKCKGHLDYNNLCANLNYLKDYAIKNYNKNKNSFDYLNSIIEPCHLNIFSFGCGLGLDYFGAKEIFNDFKYYGIDECDWAIKETENYKNFLPKLPKTINFEDGLFFLSALRSNVVICFFNSLFTISNNTENLLNKLLSALQYKNNFFIVCNFTINSNYHMPKIELNFINNLIKHLRSQFKFKRFEILDGDGIIVCGVKKI